MPRTFAGFSLFEGESGWGRNCVTKNSTFFLPSAPTSFSVKILIHSIATLVFTKNVDVRDYYSVDLTACHWLAITT